MPQPSPTDDEVPAEQPRRGRPRIHADDAARSRAYRARKAAQRPAREVRESRIDRVTEDLLRSLTETARLRARVAELEQLVAGQADELRRIRQGNGGGADR